MDSPPTFHAFSRLPFDIRIIIWRMAHSPRIITIRFDKYQMLCCNNPPPGIVQACSEARNHSGCAKVPINDESGQWIWTDFRIDTFVATEHIVAKFCDALYEDVRRLVVDSHPHPWMESWFRGIFEPFEALESVRILYAGDLSIWGWLISGLEAPCPLEKVVVVNTLNGMELNGAELST